MLRRSEEDSWKLQRLEAKVKALEQQKNQLATSLTGLRRDLFVAKEQPNQLSLDLGFDSFESLVTHVHSHAHIWNRGTIEWNASQTAILEAGLPHETESGGGNPEQQNADEEVGERWSRRTDEEIVAMQQQLEDMRAEVTRLRNESQRRLESYQQMKDNRDRFRAEWQRELRNREGFMEHLEGLRHLSGTELDRSIQKIIACLAEGKQIEQELEDHSSVPPSQPPSELKTPSKRQGEQSSTSPLAYNVVNVRAGTSTPTKPNASLSNHTSTRGSPRSPTRLALKKRKRTVTENEVVLLPRVPDESQTQEDSQMPSQFDPDISIRFTPRKRTRQSLPSSAPPTASLRQPPSVATPAPAHSPNAVPKTSPRLTRAVSRLTNRTRQPTKNISGPKRRGRYSEPGPSKAISDDGDESEYEINPDANSGRNFQFNEVVRKKRDRRALQGEDCDECREYYEAVGAMPPRLQQPLWRSPTSSPSRHAHHHHHRHRHHNSTSGRHIETSRPLVEGDVDLVEFDEHQRQHDVAVHKQDVSRHRTEWKRPKTPPAYWDIGMPDTQQTKEINARADKMHVEKEEAVRREARKDNGKFRKKQLNV